VNCPGDLKQEHLDWAEDMAMDMVVKQHFKVEQIAWLHDPELSLTLPPHQQQALQKEQQQQQEEQQHHQALQKQ
jgi:hypothetical protein